MADKAKTLHEAIQIVLADEPLNTATTAVIASEIKRRKLWTRPRDGQPPEAFQIGLRARNKHYTRWFKMPDDETVVLLKRPPRKDESQIALSVVERAIGGKLKR